MCGLCLIKIFPVNFALKNSIRLLGRTTYSVPCKVYAFYLGLGQWSVMNVKITTFTKGHSKIEI